MILVSGCARSGTSMTCAVLDACGADFGETIGPGPGNPGGFFENKSLRETLLKPYLRRLGYQPSGRLPLPKSDELPPHPGWRTEVKRRLGTAYAYKDAKTLAVWPIWAEAFPEARWVLVRRERLKIIDSIYRTPWMRLDADQARAFVDAYLEKIDELKLAGVNWTEVWPDPGDPEVFKPAVEFCGLDWNPDAVRAVLRPEWWGKK